MNTGSLIVYINGEYQPLERAHISVMDRGFLFGDGVYEVIPVYGQRIFRLAEHLQRLDCSLQAIEMANPHTDSQWESLIDSVLQRNPMPDNRSIYIQVTRGSGERDHLYDESLSPTVFILCRPLPGRDFSDGITAITHPDIRWEYCHIKAITLLANVLLKNLAHRTGGAQDAILLRDGQVTEGAASNVFVVSSGKVYTPVSDNRLLSGITRNLIIELLGGNGIECIETHISEEFLRGADEIWLTSSTMEVAPVVKLDGEAVGDGLPGKLWGRVAELYENFKQTIKSGQPVASRA